MANPPLSTDVTNTELSSHHQTTRQVRTIVQQDEWSLTQYERQRKAQPLLTDAALRVRVLPEDLRSELVCPICLDVLRRTKTTKECLHRFCSSCIIKALRSGNKECPTCRKKLVSKRSLHDDTRVDAIIAQLFPNREDASESGVGICERNVTSSNDGEESLSKRHQSSVSLHESNVTFNTTSSAQCNSNPIRIMLHALPQLPDQPFTWEGTSAQQLADILHSVPEQGNKMIAIPRSANLQHVIEFLIKRVQLKHGQTYRLYMMIGEHLQLISENPPLDEICELQAYGQTTSYITLYYESVDG